MLRAASLVLILAMAPPVEAARWSGRSGADVQSMTSSVTLVGKANGRFIRGRVTCRGSGCPIRQGRIRFTCGSFGGTIRNATTRCTLLSHACGPTLSTSPMIFTCSGRPIVDFGYIQFERVR